MLVVDDDAMNIVVLQALLRQHGVKSDQAIGGLEGLAMVKQRFESQTSMYTLLLIDYSMPGLDGPSLTIKIAKFLKEKGINMPFVCCCTAYAEENYQ